MNLNDNKLTLKSLKYLFKFIQKNKHIQKINLSNNAVDIKDKEKVIKEF